MKKSVKRGLKRTLSRSHNSASKILTKNLSKNEKVAQALKKLTQKSSGKLKELVRIQPKHGKNDQSSVSFFKNSHFETQNFRRKILRTFQNVNFDVFEL